MFYHRGNEKRLNMKEDVIKLLKIADDIHRKDELVTEAYNLLEEILYVLPEDTRKEIRKVMDLLEEV